jgi:hypothetical protein
VVAPPATPPPDLPPAPAQPAGSGRVKQLPEELKVVDNTFDGIQVDIFPTTATPRAGRGDPAEISFTLVVQRSPSDFDVTQWKSGLPQPVMHSAKVGAWKLEVTPRYRPQQLGVRTPDGHVPTVHEGWYDLQLRDAKGRSLGHLSVALDGWPTYAPVREQPSDAIATARREGDSGKLFFDFMPKDGGAALLRLQTDKRETSETIEIKSKDGEVHRFSFAHSVLRLLEPGQFVTTAAARSAERNSGSPRDPK